MRATKFLYSSSALLLCLLATLAFRDLMSDPERASSAASAPHESGATRAYYNRVPILLFHNVDGAGPYSISRESFQRHLDEIRSAGVRVIPLKQLYDHARENRLFSRPSIVITIDDDFENIVRVAAPLLREYDYPATFFFYTKDIMDDPRWGASWADLNRLYREGFDIQNHSYSHTPFHEPRGGESAAEYDRRVRREIIHSRETLEKNIPGLKVWTFAYPFGYKNAALQQKLLDAGYALTLTTDARPVDVSQPFRPSFDRYTIQRFYVRDPDALFRRQLEYALTPYSGQRQLAER